MSNGAEKETFGLVMFPALTLRAEDGKPIAQVGLTARPGGDGFVVAVVLHSPTGPAYAVRLDPDGYLQFAEMVADMARGIRHVLEDSEPQAVPS